MSLFGKRKDKETDFEDFPRIGGLMVSKMVAVDKRKPLFMYREKRTNPADSGWRIFSGYESQEYADDPDNIGIYNPSTILKIDSSIADLLLKGAGSVFERDAEKMEWYPVDDFIIEDDYIIEQPVADRWIMEINNLFEHSTEKNGVLYFTTDDKSVRITAWDSDKNKSQLYQEHQSIIANRDESMAKTIEMFEFSDSDVLRIGYLIKESDERKVYDVIYGFSIIDHQVLQVALYYDNQKDRNWAIETWKSIRQKTK